MSEPTNNRVKTYMQLLVENAVKDKEMEDLKLKNEALASKCMELIGVIQEKEEWNGAIVKESKELAAAFRTMMEENQDLKDENRSLRGKIALMEEGMEE